MKPRPHQQQCRSNIVECYKVECCFDMVAGVDDDDDDDDDDGCWMKFRRRPCYQVIRVRAIRTCIIPGRQKIMRVLSKSYYADDLA